MRAEHVIVTCLMTDVTVSLLRHDRRGGLVVRRPLLAQDIILLIIIVILKKKKKKKKSVFLERLSMRNRLNCA